VSAAPVAAAVLLFAAAAGGIALVQPRLAHTVHEVKDRDDVTPLPSPSQLRVAVLGWDAAAVDLLWADLLVQHGTHWSEHRDFTQVPRYLEAIVALEPSYPPLYQYVDTLLAYRPMQGTESDARLARAYLERGTVEWPRDARIWKRYGEYLAFLGPSFLADREEGAAWKREGAAAIGHAVELGADADGALEASSLLAGAGPAATQEVTRYLEHAYAFTDHPMMQELHEKIGRQLQHLEATVFRDAADKAARTIDARHQSELPYLPRSLYLLLGPLVDVSRCAGQAASDQGAGGGPCARSWSDLLPAGNEPWRLPSP
jgi:hypothetical protein